MRPRESLRHWTAAVRRRHDRATAEGERGTSLMELIVGMAIMAVFMSIFTGAVVNLYRAANKSQSINLASGQLTQAFTTLDETVRYAAAISAPGTGTAGSWYVELRTTNTGSEQCTQLRVEATSGALQMRTWSVTGSTAGTPGSWRQLASGLTNGAVASGSTDQPFSLIASSGGITYQRLAVVLVAQSGSAQSRTTSRSAYTLAAVNSAGATTGGVCTFSGWRP